MKELKILTTLFIACLLSSVTIAQTKVNLNDWLKREKDSLNKVGVDTIIFYHQYCGGCSVKENKSNEHCEVIDNSWTFLEGGFLYKQKGRAYSLKFNYCNAPIKQELPKCGSISYFLSILPTLKKRDQVYIQRRKAFKFFPPIPTDGSYQAATLYLKKKTVDVSLSYHQKTDGYSNWKGFFWIDKEIKLFDLIEKDTK